MADPTEAQLQTIGAAVEMMRQFGSYDAEEHEDLHVSIALPIFTIDTDGIENDGFLHAAEAIGNRFVVDGAPGLLAVDVEEGDEPQLISAVHGVAADALASLLTRLEIGSDAEPRILSIRGMRAEALWLPRTDRLVTLIGPDEDDFIGGARRQLADGRDRSIK